MILVELSPIIMEKFDQRIKKRELLSAIAKVYDPLGVMSPVMIIAPKIFQDVCKQGTVWDSPVTQETQERWDMFLQHLKILPKIAFAKYVMSSEELKEVSLHIFSDASKISYCAAAYIILEFSEGRKASLLTKKTRLAPLNKEMSIPHLES